MQVQSLMELSRAINFIILFTPARFVYRELELNTEITSQILKGSVMAKKHSPDGVVRIIVFYEFNRDVLAKSF